MVEEFEGSVPEIDIIREHEGVFFYFCKETDEMLAYPCANVSEKCYGCLGSNPKFLRLYSFNDRCSCGRKIDFGYFMIIYCLEKAGFLPKDFKMLCCICKKREKKRWEEDTKK